MKVLKGLAMAVICTLLVFVIEAVSIVICTKNILEEQVATEAIKNTVIENTSNVEDAEDIKKYIDTVSSYDGISDMIDAVLNDYVKGEVSDETIDKIMDFVKKNQKDISIITGSEQVNPDEIDTPENREELRNSMNNSFKELDKSDDISVRDAIRTYTKVTSICTLRNGIAAIIVLIGLLVLLTWSYYEWMSPLGKVFITSSTLMFILYALTYGLISFIEGGHHSFTFDNKIILIIAIVELAIGILFKVLFKTFTKIEADKPNLDQEQIIPQTEVEENSNTYE